MNDLYERVYSVVAAQAKQYGYAVALHGSGIRDLDLILCPWADHAVRYEPHVLVRTIASAIDFEFNGLHGISTSLDDLNWPAAEPKPHGRVAYIIWLSPNLALDLSVMPVQVKL
ncbi:MAG: hypothetical protein K2W95_15610 [Candidatus Obscuribacterales bacterium]|nr:hypothetical protein [Candidatus Obscuribacterales bacterium]